MDELTNAIMQAVKEQGQPETLANAINKWIQELANGNERINDEEAVQRRIEILLGQTTTKTYE